MHLPLYAFYNAIDVIRSRKILSRDRAEELGLLKYDSAGSVIFRSSKAHKFARFYFRPCTPTQYYNEALGADSKLGEWRTKWYKIGMVNGNLHANGKANIQKLLNRVYRNVLYLCSSSST